MPSALLERRPDIRAAEQALIAANANIGVAKAAYFPQITLTGSVGGQSSTLTNLFSGPNRVWSFVPQVTQPIFTAGRLKSGVRLAEAEREQALVAYERSIQTAVRIQSREMSSRLAIDFCEPASNEDFAIGLHCDLPDAEAEC